MRTELTEVLRLRAGTMKLEVHPNRRAASAAAAKAAALALDELGKRSYPVGVIFATGASQIDTLDELTATAGLPWDRVCGFHMDDYIGLATDHPASFQHYLREKLTDKVPIRQFFNIDGNDPDTEQTCLNYTAKLRSANPQLCLLGIGENGHLAFNDPELADFEDPLDVKVVHLDTVCRKQQAAEGWFNNFREVPEHAITLTIPALFRVPKLVVSVLGSRKADIMRRTLEAPISTECPATILRTHPDVTLYLDQESAASLDKQGLLK
jgi:glucosamine-6-phosphate deaminase